MKDSTLEGPCPTDINEDTLKVDVRKLQQIIWAPEYPRKLYLGVDDLSGSKDKKFFLHSEPNEGKSTNLTYYSKTEVEEICKQYLVKVLTYVQEQQSQVINEELKRILKLEI